MKENVALLLDLDNIKPELQELEIICSQYGTIAERRAFSNTPAVLAAYGSKLRDLGYRFELTPGLSFVSQEVDNLITKTALELVENPQHNIKIVAIVSNDNDYANLFLRLTSKGIHTLAIGNNQLGNKLRERATYVEFLKNILRPTYIGIDLGTTNTVIAIANQNLTQQWTANAISIPIKNEQEALQNTQLIPSSVRFSKSDTSEIGKHVRSQYYAFRDQTVLAWKHDIGVLKDGEPIKYELSIGSITPEQATAEVLKFCRNKLIQKQIDVNGVVITHPASYEPDAIEATRKAAKLAGWDEKNIVLLPEPKAALYDFLHRLRRGEIFVQLDTSRSLNILVYDLGGGTLDTSLHTVEWSSNISQFIISDIAIGSRTRVGGDRVDELIVDYLFEKYSKISRLSSPEQKKLWHELRIYAEKFKQVWGGKYLDSSDGENFKIPFDYLGLDGTFPVFYSFSYRHMQEALKDLLCPDIQPDLITQLDPKIAFNDSPFTDRNDTFIVPVLDVLLKAKDNLGKVPKIDAVLLNGGMTYFPLIRERLQKFLPETLILSEGDPDLAVARGASLFASGALKPSEGINPTNIWLEVTDPDCKASQLKLLVAHGQKYPYETTLHGFRLPAVNQGMIGFNIWVGMGTQPDQNTTLQRTRYIQAEEFQSSNIHPGDYLDLEVSYTYDERLLLTLIHRDCHEARFKLEVSPQRTTPKSSISMTAITVQGKTISAKNLIPSIPRFRSGREPDHNIQVQFTEWGRVTHSLSRDWQSGAIQSQRRNIENQTRQATNRLAIVQSLLQWLEQDNTVRDVDLRRTRQIVAAMSLSNIMQAIPSESPDFKARELEQRYHKWILRQFQAGLSRFHVNNELHTAISLTPGKMQWSDFGELIYQEFIKIADRPFSAALLNSFGICAEGSARNLSRLQSIVQENPHLALRLKAFWALARLISPGQPSQWQVPLQEVEKVAFFVLNQLKHRIIEPQIALDALGSLSQAIAWHMSGYLLPESIVNEILSLSKFTLPCQGQMQSYPQISVQFSRKLELLETACDLSAATEKDIQDLQAWFLEIAKS